MQKRKDILSYSYKWLLKNPHYFLIPKYRIDTDSVDTKPAQALEIGKGYYFFHCRDSISGK